MERYTLMQASLTKRVCNSCLEEKVLGGNFYRHYSYKKEQCEKDGKWAYVHRCISCYAKYQAKYERECLTRTLLGRERLADFRGFSSYKEYEEAKEQAIHKPCPICGVPLSNKGWTEATCLRRRDNPNTYPDFICRKCVNAVRHLKSNQNLLDFINTYDIPLDNTPEKGFKVTNFKQRKQRREEVNV